MTAFAIKHVPGVDKGTLKAFLELVNVDGAHGSLTNQKFVEKMRMMLKHVPTADIDSLLTLAELLNIVPKLGQTAGTCTLAEPHFTPPSASYQAVLN